MRLLFIIAIMFSLVADGKAQTGHASSPQVKYSGRAKESNAAFITISAPDGKQYRAYVAGPADAKLGVLLVHDFFGLSEAIKQSARHLGALGYRVVAVDLYKGKSAKTNEEANALMNAKDSSETDQILKAAISYLSSSKRKLACIGFSAGGIDAMRATLIQPDLFKATVIVYGGGYDKLPSSQLSKLKTPVLAITGSLDKWPFDAALNFLSAHPDKSMELHVYSGADHGYAQPLFNSGRNYSAQLTAMTWKLTEEFLYRHVTEPQPLK